MGAQQSSSHPLKNVSQRTQALRNQIFNTADEIVDQAISLGWKPDNPTLCNMIELYYRNQLMGLSRELIKDSAVQLGMRIPPNRWPALTGNDKQYYCNYIIEFYRKKLEAANYIRNNLINTCEAFQDVIHANAPSMLSGTPTFLQDDVKNRIRKLNDVLFDYYSRVFTDMKLVRDAQDSIQLNEAIRKINSDMTDGTRKCCVATEDLRDFLWTQYTPPQVGPQGQTVALQNEYLIDRPESERYRWDLPNLNYWKISRAGSGDYSYCSKESVTIPTGEDLRPLYNEYMQRKRQSQENDEFTPEELEQGPEADILPPSNLQIALQQAIQAKRY